MYLGGGGGEGEGNRNQSPQDNKELITPNWRKPLTLVQMKLK